MYNFVFLRFYVSDYVHSSLAREKSSHWLGLELGLGLMLPRLDRLTNPVYAIPVSDRKHPENHQYQTNIVDDGSSKRNSSTTLKKREINYFPVETK